MPSNTLDNYAALSGLVCCETLSKKENTVVNVSVEEVEVELIEPERYKNGLINYNRQTVVVKIEVHAERYVVKFPQGADYRRYLRMANIFFLDAIHIKGMWRCHNININAFPSLRSAKVWFNEMWKRYITESMLVLEPKPFVVDFY